MKDDVQASWCEEAQSIQDRLEVQKCCSQPSQVACFCHSDGFHVYMFLQRKIWIDHLKDFSLSQCIFVLGEAQFVSSIVVSKVCNMFGFELLHNLLLGISQPFCESTLDIFGSDRVLAGSNGAVVHRKPLNRMMWPIYSV